MPAIKLDVAVEAAAASGDATVASFDSLSWSMGVRLQAINAIFKRLAAIEQVKDDPYKAKIAKLVFQDALRDLAVTIYHEARHCQQDFWMIALYYSHQSDYSKFSQLEKFIEFAYHSSVREVAKKTAFPNDDRVLTGVHHLFIFAYWWEIAALRNKPEWSFLEVDASEAQSEASELRGVSPEQVAKMAAYDPGYYSQYHEEDAYATEDAVRQYWENGDSASVLNPGVCTPRYESTLRTIGVTGNG